MCLPDVIIVAVPNEMASAIPRQIPEEIANKIRMARIVKLKGMGMYPGAPDMFIFWQDSGLQVGALETKDKAPQSVNQVKFENHWNKIGGRYAIWRNLEQLQKICESWGLKPVFNTPNFTPASRPQMKTALYHQAMLDMWGKK
jgi:hypothetical protein